MQINPMPVYKKCSKKPKKERINDRDFLGWLRTFPCAICGKNPPSEAAHVRLGNRGGLAQKPLFSAVPTCHSCHQQQHNKSHISIMTTEKWLELADYYFAKYQSIRQLGF